MLLRREVALCGTWSLFSAEADSGAVLEKSFVAAQTSQQVTLCSLVQRFSTLFFIIRSTMDFACGHMFSRGKDAVRYVKL
jgi:hypothetical protein